MKATSFEVNEWKWFQIQLRLQALECAGEQLSYRFEFGDVPNRLECLIYGQPAEAFQTSKTPRSEQIEYYRSWVAIAKQLIADSMHDTPELANSFDIDRDATFEILYGYGMGAAKVCTIRGNDVQWA